MVFVAPSITYNGPPLISVVTKIRLLSGLTAIAWGYGVGKVISTKGLTPSPSITETVLTPATLLAPAA